MGFEKILLIMTAANLNVGLLTFSEKKITTKENAIIVGDTRDILKNLPDNFYASCITSPPYWGVRDYGIENQIGAEFEIEDFVQNLVLVFREVRNKLKEDGTLWLNLGDSYTSGNRKWRAEDKKNPGRAMSYRPPTPDGLKPKDLVGVPWKVAFALQKDGWYLRSDIIWHKPNCQPESVKDRPTQSHEYIFLLTKSEKYYYDYIAVKEENKKTGKKRNRRSVWSINTEPYSGAHFATFPRMLVRPMVLASSRSEDFILDPFLGSGTVGEVATLLGRKFHGIELNPDYANLALERISSQLNGKLI